VDLGSSFSVAVLGFEEKERALFRNILQLSEQRPLEFRAFSKQHEKYPHIVIVNGDNDSALGQWGEFAKAHAGVNISAILLSRGEVPAGIKYVLSRPFLASRLFALLEKVVAEEHGYVAPSVLDSSDDLLALEPETVAPKPATQAAPAAVAPVAVAPPAAKAVTKSSGNVLVVDDSLPVRIQLKSILDNIVPSVVFAETGEEALDLAEKQSFDIVFLDLILPGIDGYETCKRLRKMSHLQKTPIIMLTSNSSPADRAKSKLAGCDTYLIKPVKKGMFENVVREFLKLPAAA
jgi:two-component system, cell cycle response regulator